MERRDRRAGADGSPIPLWQAAIAHLGAAGKSEYFSGIARDITEMKVAQTELRMSEERFRSLLANGSDVILVLDADGNVTSIIFKRVNDSFGHAAGDDVLVGVSERLKENLWSTALPVRRGGDEFVVLLGRERLPIHSDRHRRTDRRGTRQTVSDRQHRRDNRRERRTGERGPDPTADALMPAAEAADYEAKRTSNGRLVETAS